MLGPTYRSGCLLALKPQPQHGTGILDTSKHISPERIPVPVSLTTSPSGTPSMSLEATSVLISQSPVSPASYNNWHSSGTQLTYMPHAKLCSVRLLFSSGSSKIALIKDSKLAGKELGSVIENGSRCRAGKDGVPQRRAGHMWTQGTRKEKSTVE